MKTFFVPLLALELLVSGIAFAQDKPAPAPRFASLSTEDISRLDRQRNLIAAAVKQRYGAVISRSRKDLPFLQKLIDESVFSKTQTYELQSLGVAFGDVLSAALPLHWAMITDEYGTDPTLQFKTMPVNVNALTMISKRLERGQKVNLQELLEATRQQLTTWENKYR